MDKDELAVEMYNYMNERGLMADFIGWAENRGFGDLSGDVDEAFEN
jgi:hypothetical protein